MNMFLPTLRVGRNRGADFVQCLAPPLSAAEQGTGPDCARRMCAGKACSHPTCSRVSAAIDRVLRKKYGMSCHDFERSEIVRERGYTWEVESDSDEWEMAMDGIQSMKRGLDELLGEALLA
jgi:hypothetical protein